MTDCICWYSQGLCTAHPSDAPRPTPPEPAAPAPEPDEAERCQRCGDALFACELPDSTCRFSVEARTFLEDHGYDSVGDLATLLRAAEARGRDAGLSEAEAFMRLYLQSADASAIAFVVRHLRALRGPR